MPKRMPREVCWGKIDTERKHHKFKAWRKADVAAKD